MNEKRRSEFVNFRGRDYTVEFIQLWGSSKFDICLADAKTGDLCLFCTSVVDDTPRKTNQLLIKEEMVALLTDAGFIRATVEQVETERYGTLVVCDVLDGPTHSAWEQADMPRHEPQRQAEISAIRDQVDSVFERDAIERDLGDEFER